VCLREKVRIDGAVCNVWIFRFLGINLCKLDKTPMATPQRILRDVTQDSLAIYLADVRRRPVPTPEEEQALARRIQAGDEQALRGLVEGNLRFVVQVALKYRGYGLPLSDLINEGNLGLLHAARKFDPARGTRFITYAVWWIRQGIMHALARGGGAVRLPIRQAEALSKLRKKFEELHQQKDREPTVEELAQALDMTREDVEDLLRVYRPHLSLDVPIAEETGTTPLELLQSRTLPSTEEAYLQASMVHEVEELLAQLEPREAQILRERFGFEGEPKSLAEIGRELGLSRERVRQLEARAQRKLRALAKEKALDHYLN
jgi:RNA polymerase primary sigma factor